MQLYVGTLYCGENELAECTAKIQSQTYRGFHHFVFRFFSNKEAHDTLFSDFLRRPEFGIMIKIDADVVLREANFFERVVRMIEERPEIDLIEFVVYDWFERVVNLSLNCYRQGFSIRDKGGLFVDRITDIPKSRRMVADYVAAVHCPNPSDYQAFHFGFHAQIKERHVSITNTFRAYLRTRERRRGLALCGALAVMRGALGRDHLARFRDPNVEAASGRAARRGTLSLFLYVVPGILAYRAQAVAVRGVRAVRRRLRRLRGCQSAGAAGSEHGPVVPDGSTRMSS